MRHLHIVSIHIPYPPDYGGAIDEYYRLRTLKELGISVTMHCFLYGTRKMAPELEQCCTKVYYYKRAMTLQNAIGRRPFIVRSRKDPMLLENLRKDDSPILFEGIHTCAYIGESSLAQRLKLVRMHNIEWGYYHYLAEHEPNPLKRLYFRSESAKLKRYEDHVFHHAQVILPISHSDMAYFDKHHAHVIHLPPFHGFDKVMIEPGTGQHILVHGDFRILDNARAAIEVAMAASAEGIPCVIAGKSPSEKMQRTLERLSNIRLMPDVSAEVMLRLKQDAQMHVVHSENPSGFKIKLLNALFSGRHVLVQRNIVEGEHLEEVTHAFSNRNELQQLMRMLRDKPMTTVDISRRESLLLPRFSNTVNAQNLINLIFP
jgi:glycosyltransferase involved in cell wall biosynthesis